ncbi:MAG: hypothetical protein QOD77_1061 [Thermoplasmata archaeon]|nr:hypothetical protein [Thermoplasmata archaeon]
MAALLPALHAVGTQQERLQEARAAILEGRQGEVFIPRAEWDGRAADPRAAQMLAHIDRALESLDARLAQHGLTTRRPGGFAIDLARVRAAPPAIRANALAQVRTVQHYTVPAAAGLIHGHGTAELRSRSRAWMQP